MLSDRSICRSSSSLFTPWKMTRKGIIWHHHRTSVKSCWTTLGELGKYEDGWSGKSRLDQTIAYHTKDSLHSFTFVCLGKPRSRQRARMMKGVYTNENSTAICTEVAYFLDSHTDESKSRTSSAMEVETVNAMMDDDSVERCVEACGGEHLS